MKLQKVSINFIKFTDADLLTKADHIRESMADNPNFPDPLPSLANVSTAIDFYRTALIAAGDLGRENVALKNERRKTLELLLQQLGMYAMTIANGNVAILTGSGFTLTKEPEPRYITNPGNVTLTNGVTTGEMEARVTKVKGATHFLHQIATELPTEQTVWTSTPSSRCKFVYTDLTPGRQYWVRIAAVASGEQIAYSPVATQFAQ